MKIRKNQIIITTLAIMLAVAGYINYTGNLSELTPVKNQEEQEELQNPVDEVSNDILSNDAEPDDASLQDPGEVVFTNSQVVNSNMISSAKLNREQIRAKNKETLLEVINNDKISEAAKTKAINELASITSNSEKEIATELLLEGKGFNNVIVSMLDGKVEVVINRTGITDVERAQIEDIVKRKTGVTADKISINICNN